MGSKTLPRRALLRPPSRDGHPPPGGQPMLGNAGLAAACAMHWMRSIVPFPSRHDRRFLMASAKARLVAQRY